MIHVEDSRDRIIQCDNANKYVCRDTHQSWISSSGKQRTALIRLQIPLN